MGKCFRYLILSHLGKKDIWLYSYIIKLCIECNICSCVIVQTTVLFIQIFIFHADAVYTPKKTTGLSLGLILKGSVWNHTTLCIPFKKKNISSGIPFMNSRTLSHLTNPWEIFITERFKNACCLNKVFTYFLFYTYIHGGMGERPG